MSLQKFKIVSPKDGQSVDNIFESLLINTDHIISLKPIRMVVDEKLVMGYWIRTSNGKKYRAVDVPDQIKTMLEDEAQISVANLNVLSDEPTQNELLN